MNINFYLTKPVCQIGGSHGENRSFDRKQKKSTTSKIERILLNEMSLILAQSKSGLLISSVALEIIQQMLFRIMIPFFQGGKEAKKREVLPSLKQMHVKRDQSVKYIPVGLRSCDRLPWLNSLMQFLLFVGPRELFSFIPRSFEPFRKFVDEYTSDSALNRSVSSVSADCLIPCLSNQLIVGRIEVKKENFYDIFKAIIELLFSSIQSQRFILLKGTSLDFDQHVLVDGEGGFSLEEIIHQKRSPLELLVAFNQISSSRVIRKQCFISEQFLCYELDSFVEVRSEQGGLAHFIAYMKIDGVWYQCDDERIRLLRSNLLESALSRSVLLRYKRIGIMPGSFELGEWREL